MKMNVKNCLQCKHFFKNMVYEYHKEKKYIINIYKEMGCKRLNMKFISRNSEEKENEDKFITNKCFKGKYFEEMPKINIYEIVYRDV
jgi:hypothetical protein